MLKNYVGTKRLLAQPMTRGAYNNYRGWPLPANESPADDGYLVEYLDGGAPNDYPRHAGYISWSPKDVFERSYRVVAPPVPSLRPHQQPVVEEKEELDHRLSKLGGFFGTDTFEALDTHERDRLFAQEAAMEAYSNVLAERIAAFKQGAPA